MAASNLPPGDLPSLIFSAPADLTKPDFERSESLLSNYGCIFCNQVINPPALQMLCGHRACSTCIEGFIHSGDKAPKSCPGEDPECKQVDLQQGNYFPDFSFTKELGRLKVHCSNKPYGCLERVPWSKLAQHLKNCEYVLVKCRYLPRGCPEEFPRIYIDKHEEDCSYNVYIACMYCEESILKQEMDEGHVEMCKRKQCQCPLSIIGCDFVGDDKQGLKKHTEDNISQHAILVKQVYEEMKNVEELIITEIQRIRLSVGDNRAIIAKVNKDFQDFKSRFDVQLRKLQKMAAINSENLIELKNLQEIFVGVRKIQENLKTNERRLLNLERGGGDGRETMEMTSEGQLPGLPVEIQHRVTHINDSYQRQDQMIRDFGVRIHALEVTSFDGKFIWKVTDYRRLKSEAVAGTELSVFSPPFFTGLSGYKLCLRLYPNGDGMGLNTHVSVYITLMKGEFDALLVWPMRHKVVISLMDQETHRRNITDAFRPDPTSNSFKKPENEANIASGFPLFVPQAVAESSTYLRDDTVFIRAQVIPP